MNVKISLNLSKSEKIIYVRPNLIFAFLILYIRDKINIVNKDKINIVNKEQPERDIEFPTRRSGRNDDSGFVTFLRFHAPRRKLVGERMFFCF